ncbi:unnamed protein product [Arctia plantaginis]|uniref:Uncharacterized protein n=1 Tax=Arctia plantaginis TaxID=874455 RepID=A0A8S1AH51_ARCPL|nr:unnamed protein product [Arctia plantaginis]
MSAFEALLPLYLFVVAIAADVWNIDSPEDSVIDDVIVDGNESLFSAFIIMESNKDSEEIILDSNEEKNVETVLPHDNTKLKRVVTDSVNVDDITGNGDKIDRPDVLLRKRPWKGCLKKASKMCKKACKAAVKDACDYYDCKKKLKKGLKKECKKSCKRQFLDDY